MLKILMPMCDQSQKVLKNIQKHLLISKQLYGSKKLRCSEESEGFMIIYMVQNTFIDFHIIANVNVISMKN
jgi:hypothetical protein